MEKNIYDRKIQEIDHRLGNIELIMSKQRKKPRK
jgi:hypothetical protein